MGWTAACTLPIPLRLLLSFSPALSVALSAFRRLLYLRPSLPLSLPWGPTEEAGTLGSLTACWSDLAQLSNGELGIVPLFLSQQTYLILLALLTAAVFSWSVDTRSTRLALAFPFEPLGHITSLTLIVTSDSD